MSCERGCLAHKSRQPLKKALWRENQLHCLPFSLRQGQSGNSTTAASSTRGQSGIRNMQQRHKDVCFWTAKMSMGQALNMKV